MAPPQFPEPLCYLLLGMLGLIISLVSYKWGHFVGRADGWTEAAIFQDKLKNRGRP